MGVMAGRPSLAPTDVFRQPGFFAFWLAETVSGFGTVITTMALQVLVVVSLDGSASDVGWVNAARWLPYVFLGLFVGVVIERARRKPVLVATDLARAMLLGALPLIWSLGWLNLFAVMAFVALFGIMTLLNDAATQSFLPRLVPAPALLAANARLAQGDAAAQTAGPVVAGGLIAALGAPLAVLVDAASYLASAILTARLSVHEPAGRRTTGPDWRREIAEGLAWIYHHPMLAPLAVSTHAWFVCQAVVGAVFVPFVLLDLRLSAIDLGWVLAAGGIAGLIGSLIARPMGAAWGPGRTVIACRAVMPLAWALIAFVPDDGPVWATMAQLAMGQALFGFAMAAESPSEMGYWQAATPDPLQGRTNATRRSISRAMIVVGAPAGGMLADTIGFRPAMGLAAFGFALAALGLALSRFRHASLGDEGPDQAG